MEYERFTGFSKLVPLPKKNPGNLVEPRFGPKFTRGGDSKVTVNGQKKVRKSIKFSQWPIIISPNSLTLKAANCLQIFQKHLEYSTLLHQVETNIIFEESN